MKSDSTPWLTTDTFNYKNNPSSWDSGLITQIDEPNGSVRKRIWAQNKPYDLTSISVYKTPNNPYVQRETVTVGNAVGAPTKTAVTDFSYDKNGNLLTRNSYDWVPYSSSGVETGTAKRRETTMTYWVSLPDASVTTNDPNAYWWAHNPTLWPNPASARRLNAVRRGTVSQKVMAKKVTMTAESFFTGFQM